MSTPTLEPAKTATDYKLFHPRWYRPRVSVYWWLGQRHLKFILRELSSVFVAYFVVMTLFLIRDLRNGPEAYAHFLRCMQSPWAIVLNAIACSSWCSIPLRGSTWRPAPCPSAWAGSGYPMFWWRRRVT